MTRLGWRGLRVALSVVVIATLWIAGTTDARAQNAACTVIEVHASQAPSPRAPGVQCQRRSRGRGLVCVGAEIPPRLARKLKRPPFSSWRTFRVAQMVRKSFQPKTSHAIPLQAGSLVIRRHSNANHQYKFAVILKNPRGKRVLRTKIGVSPRSYFLVAGLPLGRPRGRGMQVLALTCRPAP